MMRSRFGAKTMLLCLVLVVLVVVCAIAPVYAQPSINTWQAKIGTYTNSTIDTTWIYLEGQGFAIDSVQFAVETADSARYRTALLFKNGVGGTTASYVITAGATSPVDTSSSLTAVLNPMYVWEYVPPGIRIVGLVTQYSAAGNHVGVTRQATKLFTVWVKAFYRYKKE